MKHLPRKTYLPFGKPNFSQREIDAVTRVLASGWIGMGEEVLAFENELASHTGAKHIVSVNSCTSALFLSLHALGIEPGDEVICPSLTWCSTANAAIHLGATPVLCDVDEASLCVTPDTVLPLLTPRTRAVMVVHMGGLAADVPALRAALPDHVAIVEDAAHALGASYPDGSSVGSSDNLTCFSFYANKNLSTGEGGAIATCDDALAERLRALRQHGQTADAWRRFKDPNPLLAAPVSEIGFKMNYTDLQACIGRVQLARQGEFRERRLDIARRYIQTLAPYPDAVGLQTGIGGFSHARHLFVIILKSLPGGTTRDHVITALREQLIGASLHYLPLHRQPAYASALRLPLPVTDRLADRILTLPISASMLAEDADEVVERLLDLLGLENPT